MDDHELQAQDALALARFSIRYANAHLDAFQRWLAACYPDVLPVSMCAMAEADGQIMELAKAHDGNRLAAVHDGPWLTEDGDQ